MNPIYHIQTTPAACPENIVAGEHYRITVLTQGLLRLEYSPDGIFEDRPTQTVLHRDFPKTNFRVLHQDGQLEIHTDRLHLVYDEKPFSAQGLSIQVKGALTLYHSIWRYGQKASDLGGTARTLDEANGARFIRYLGKVAGQTQFLLITHRRETMEAADVLYGVTMERQGVSRVLKLDLRQAEELLGSRPA